MWLKAGLSGYYKEKMTVEFYEGLFWGRERHVLYTNAYIIHIYNMSIEYIHYTECLKKVYDLHLKKEERIIWIIFVLSFLVLINGQSFFHRQFFTPLKEGCKYWKNPKSLNWDYKNFQRYLDFVWRPNGLWYC